MERFRTPEQEITHLREQLRTQRESLSAPEQGDEAAVAAVREYAARPAEEVLHPAYSVPEKEAEAIVLELAPEAHDEKISEFLGMLEEKGIHNTLSIVEKMRDPHLADDFHRFLVQYLKGGFPVAGLKEKSPLSQSLKMTLFEITLPEFSEEKNNGKTLKELISSMEQFYAGMLSVGNSSSRDVFTLELSVANHSNEFVFYAAVPDEKRNLFEKHIFSSFPKAQVVEKKDDYNIFNESGAVAFSTAALTESAAYPIKTYDLFDLDPINAVLNSFSNIDKDGEGAAIQIVFCPHDNAYTEQLKNVLQRLHKGIPTKEAVEMSAGLGEGLKKEMKKFILGSSKTKKPGEEKVLDEPAIKQVTAKAETPIIAVNVRLVASAATEAEAAAILSDLESSFNQFENTQGNRLAFTRERGRVKKLTPLFSYRQFDHKAATPLSLRELATIMHFPVGSVSSAQVKILRAATAPAPFDLPQEGTLLGVNSDRGRETPVYLAAEDRLRHLYVIGQTGTGKTSFLKNMIAQDIARGDGACFIDPHGSDVQDILGMIPPERRQDVIYFDPAYTKRPMALNMLEYDTRFPEQKTFVVNEMLSIFNKLFDMKTTGGPLFEQYFRNAVLLTIDNPATGNTLLDVSRVLSDAEFRNQKLAQCTNPLVVQFWRDIAGKAEGEAALQNIVPYIVSKFDNFLSNDIMRPVIAQGKSTFNFRELMDNRKILLVNLSKGRLGDINAHLIGLVLVGKILMAALSRVGAIGNQPAGGLPPFYLYIDEFQNVTTDSIATILSEARKYKLSLTIAHQFIAQLEAGTKDAVFGNVGSFAVFRVGAEDAEYLERLFAPEFTARDMTNIENFNAYVKLLIHGKPVKPFNIKATAPGEGDLNIAEKLKEFSYLTYGKPREEIEADIRLRYS